MFCIILKNKIMILLTIINFDIIFKKRFYNRGTLRGIRISRFSNRGNHLSCIQEKGGLKDIHCSCTKSPVYARLNFGNIYYKLKNQMQFLLCFHNLWQRRKRIRWYWKGEAKNLAQRRKNSLENKIGGIFRYKVSLHLCFFKTHSVTP